MLEGLAKERETPKVVKRNLQRKCPESFSGADISPLQTGPPSLGEAENSPLVPNCLAQASRTDLGSVTVGLGACGYHVALAGQLSYCTSYNKHRNHQKGPNASALLVTHPLNLSIFCSDLPTQQQYLPRIDVIKCQCAAWLKAAILSCADF